MKKTVIALAGVLIISVAMPLFAATVRVPEDWATIQQGIDRADDGDTVSVADGTYTGPENVDLVLRGKSIILTSRNGAQNCIIDCQGTQNDPHRGFNLDQGETETTVIQGFTIQNGYRAGVTTDDSGGGIQCIGSSPTIRECIIQNNTAVYSGGLRFSNESKARLIARLLIIPLC
ncbi:hypothetical protein K8T06_02215 [bacterium]|nr:hypothetical protein [bacterium]